MSASGWGTSWVLRGWRRALARDGSLAHKSRGPRALAREVLPPWPSPVRLPPLPLPGVKGRGPVGVAPHLQDEALTAAGIDPDRQERRLHRGGLAAGRDALQLVLPV